MAVDTTMRSANQGCRAVVKITQLRSSSFHENGSSSSALGFRKFGSGALFVHGSGFCSFSHINIFNCLGVP